MYTSYDQWPASPCLEFLSMKDNAERWGVSTYCPQTLTWMLVQTTNNENSWVNYKSLFEISLEGWRAHKSTCKEMAEQSAGMNTAISLSWKETWVITLEVCVLLLAPPQINGSWLMEILSQMKTVALCSNQIFSNINTRVS